MQELIHNALSALADGGHIRLRTEKRGAEAVLSVSDDGEGIPETLLDVVFEAFISGVPGENPGLGLSMVGKIAGDHEGQFRKWLFTLALNKILQKAKFHDAAKRSADREVPPNQGADRSDTRSPEQVLGGYESMVTPSRHVVAAEEVLKIERVFDELSDQYKKVIQLSCFLSTCKGYTLPS